MTKRWTLTVVFLWQGFEFSGLSTGLIPYCDWKNGVKTGCWHSEPLQNVTVLANGDPDHGMINSGEGSYFASLPKASALLRQRIPGLDPNMRYGFSLLIAPGTMAVGAELTVTIKGCKHPISAVINPVPGFSLYTIADRANPIEPIKKQNIVITLNNTSPDIQSAVYIDALSLDELDQFTECRACPLYTYSAGFGQVSCSPCELECRDGFKLIGECTPTSTGTCVPKSTSNPSSGLNTGETALIVLVPMAVIITGFWWAKNKRQIRVSQYSALSITGDAGTDDANDDDIPNMYDSDDDQLIDAETSNI